MIAAYTSSGVTRHVAESVVRRACEACYFHDLFFFYFLDSQICKGSREFCFLTESEDFLNLILIRSFQNQLYQRSEGYFFSVV